MRATIAARLLESKTRIPHFYLHIEIDAAPLLALRKQVNAASEESANPNKYTLNDFILAAASAAAVQVPKVNASFDGDAILQHESINLAVAVAVEDGLVTPVIRDAQSKSLLEISRAVKDLAERARNKRLSPNDYSGGTLTVSSLGAYGIESFDAIINPPQAAILSIGAITAKPVLNADEEVVPGKRLDVGMSCDHRVVDGAIGAAYLAEFKKIIERPAILLV
jgi:pyruvate dehydrogenase E2 component (dihydrolipoamide acetyltransferase)